MPIMMASDTGVALGADAKECTSRALLLERFADPGAKDEDRKHFFNRVLGLKASTVKAEAWEGWLQPLSQSPENRIVHAQLQARLLINMAGGVMENAGLCLDRFGIPYIPGSAVKGCARRTALAALRAWCEAGGMPTDKPNDEDDLLASACVAFSEPAEMLTAIARVFGWGDADWKDPSNDSASDLAWACGNTHWQSLREAAQAGLSRITHGMGDLRFPGAFAGSVGFLPAYPQKLECAGTQPEGLALSLPPLGALELDIVTCHHRDYYEGKASHPQATDDEEPNPVVFPAVQAGHLFAFPLLSLRGSAPSDVDSAAAWLAGGLRAFGLGAKTNAGYGWFDTDDRLQHAVQGFRARAAKARKDIAERAALEAEAKNKEAERLERKRTQDAAMASLLPDEREDYLVRQLSDDQFRAAMENFGKRGDAERRAIVRALRQPLEEPGSRRKFWDDLKDKAQKKGGKWGTLADAIRSASKAQYPGKEGKMP